MPLEGVVLKDTAPETIAYLRCKVLDAKELVAMWPWLGSGGQIPGTAPNEIKLHFMLTLNTFCSA